jgi:hypothetical protein
MGNDQCAYHAYLLRLWRVNAGRTQVWQASLEDAQTGEQKGFADLKNLFAFLEEQTGDSQPRTGHVSDRSLLPIGDQHDER